MIGFLASLPRTGKRGRFAKTHRTYQAGTSVLERPRYSVITVCLNSEKGIRQTLESVANQQNVSCEHVVVDGGSRDATTTLIRTHLRRDGIFISERDNGIADAMNKGIALSHGEWLLFLQSDDFLIDEDVLAGASSRLHPDIDVCCFPVLFGNDHSRQLVRPRSSGFRLNFKGISHQGALIRRSLFDRIGVYDTSFGITMDYDFFLRAYRAGARFERSSAPVLSFMRDSGVSSQSDWPSLQGRFEEERRAHRKNQSALLMPLYSAWWAIYPYYRKLRAALTHGHQVSAD